MFLDNRERKALDHRGFSNTRLAGQNRIVLTTAHQDVHDLADLGIAPEDRIDPPRLSPLRKVDRVLVECRRKPAAARGGARLYRFGRGCGRRLGARVAAYDREVFTQGFGRDACELRRTLTRTASQALVREQGDEQVAGADLRRTTVKRGDQPCFPRHRHNLGRKGWRAGIASLQLLDNPDHLRRDPAGVDLKMAHDQREITVLHIEQLQQPMLDLDIVVTARKRVAGRRFERPAAGVVHLAD